MTLNRFTRPGPFCLLATAVILASGCTHGGPKIIDVSGTVTYHNQPVPAGVIFFDPDPSKKHDGPQGYAYIKNGYFNTAENNGRGVVAGPHAAHIHGCDGKPGQELPMGKMIFPEYLIRVELTEGVPVDITVPFTPDKPKH